MPLEKYLSFSFSFFVFGASLRKGHSEKTKAAWPEKGTTENAMLPIPTLCHTAMKKTIATHGLTSPAGDSRNRDT